MLGKLLDTARALSPIKQNSGNEKPSEPASPSPPPSPYYTTSPFPETPGKEAKSRAEAPENNEPQPKTPTLHKSRHNQNDAKALGDFLAQQKRSFAELADFKLEVAVTPKRVNTFKRGG